MAQASFYCPQCQTMKLFVGEEMNHTAHILAIIFLCGLWLPFWILSAATYKPQYRCINCGYSDGTDYLADPTLRSRQIQAEANRANQRAEQKARYLETAEQSEGWRRSLYKFLAFEHSTTIIVGFSIVTVVVGFVVINSLTQIKNQSSQYVSPTPQASSSHSIQNGNSMPTSVINQGLNKLPQNKMTKPQNNADGSLTEKLPKPKSTKSASVIMENANLRVAPTSDAEVVGTVPEFSMVEVIKQQGPWFLVQTDLGKGWMHGNTLKLEDY